MKCRFLAFLSKTEVVLRHLDSRCRIPTLVGRPLPHTRAAERPVPSSVLGHSPTMCLLASGRRPEVGMPSESGGLSVAETPLVLCSAGLLVAFVLVVEGQIGPFLLALLS